MKEYYIRGKQNYICEKIRIENRDMYRLFVVPKMSNSDYDRIKYRIESLGGHWREKLHGFIFEDNPMEKLKTKEFWQKPIVQTEYDKWRIQRQFYPTPRKIAEEAAQWCEINPHNSVLDPSAGRGALILPLGRKDNIQAVEIDPGLAGELKEMGFNVIQMSFDDACEKGLIESYDRVIMNPPFAKQIGLKHVMKAYEHLNKNGILVTILSENDLYYKTDLTDQFIDFLKEKNAKLRPIPMGSFKESDTTIDTVMIKIKKT